MPNCFINERLLPLARDPETLLVYPHAQRTGGVTMRKRVLATAYGEAGVYNGHYIENAKEWYQLGDEDLRGYRAFVDIFNYSEPRFQRPFVLIATLRHPVYRAVSFYFYVRGRAQHSQHELANRTTLEEFFRQGSELKAKYHSNVQCMRVCGRPSADAAIDLIRQRYIGAGSTNALAEFVAALGQVFSWPALAVDTVAPDAERYDGIVTPDYREMVLAKNREDMRLFEALTEATL